MANKNNNLVVAYYVNDAAAEAAAEDLKRWDKANDAVKLGAIGILTLNRNNGELEVKEIGQRDTKKGALWGAAIGTAAGILTAGVALIPGLILGTAGGGALGALNHKSLGMTDADRSTMADNLRNGGAALAVMADDFEVADTKAEMIRLGGVASTFKVPAETADILTATAEAQASAGAAIDEAVSNVGEGVEGVTRSATAGVSDIATGVAGAAGSLAAIGGLSVDEAQKLFDSGVQKASALLARGATPAGRAALAKETGLSEAAILASVKRLDLMRLKGVGAKYAGLLLASGVDTVPELATRNAANLVSKMGEVNALQSLVSDLPSVDVVSGWVAQAKELPKMITY
jgi:predicted flap endonuclease-1-like 5' DNA nuclease